MENFLWGLVNGITAWPVLIAHAFDAWNRYPFYNAPRSSGLYDLGFLLGAGSPIFGLFGWDSK